MLRAFGSADNFVTAELPMPDVGKGEVRIKVRAVSFNPVDFQIRKGRPESTHVRSMILGRDLSGTVDAVHDEVTGFKIGDEVFSYVCNRASSGTYAEFVSVPAELVARKPASLSHEEAAAVPVAAITASLALKKAQVGESTSLFVAGGAGGVGTFAIMLARQMGVRKLVTTAGSARSRAYLSERCGVSAAQIVDYKQEGFVERAIEQNGGGFDAALDLVGGKMLSSCCALLALDGNLASVTEAPSVDDFEILFEKNASFHSVGAHAYSLSDDRANWMKYRVMLEHLSRLFDRAALSPPPTQNLGKMSAEVVRQAHALMESGTVQGKLVMNC
ncbi:MAG: NADP-dependent oxidoreductase [Alphaproteobacteria bacterium]|nr:NADP-dependent oxidoreductase [Alphaproteobacteria bacterium]